MSKDYNNYYEPIYKPKKEKKVEEVIMGICLVLLFINFKLIDDTEIFPIYIVYCLKAMMYIFTFVIWPICIAYKKSKISFLSLFDVILLSFFMTTGIGGLIETKIVYLSDIAYFEKNIDFCTKVGIMTLIALIFIGIYKGSEEGKKCMEEKKKGEKGRLSTIYVGISVLLVVGASVSQFAVPMYKTSLSEIGKQEIILENVVQPDYIRVSQEPAETNKLINSYHMRYTTKNSAEIKKFVESINGYKARKLIGVEKNRNDIEDKVFYDIVLFWSNEKERSNIHDGYIEKIRVYSNGRVILQSRENHNYVYYKLLTNDDKDVFVFQSNELNKIADRRVGDSKKLLDELQKAFYNKGEH